MTTAEQQQFSDTAEAMAIVAGIDKRDPTATPQERERSEQIERLAIGIYRLITRTGSERSRLRSAQHHSELAAGSAVSSMTPARGDATWPSTHPKTSR